jgi:hypothetical protein
MSAEHEPGPGVVGHSFPAICNCAIWRAQRPAFTELDAGKAWNIFLEVESLVSFNFWNHSVQDFASLCWGHGLSQLGRIATG